MNLDSFKDTVIECEKAKENNAYLDYIQTVRQSFEQIIAPVGNHHMINVFLYLVDKLQRLSNYRYLTYTEDSTYRSLDMLVALQKNFEANKTEEALKIFESSLDMVKKSLSDIKKQQQWIAKQQCRI